MKHRGAQEGTGWCLPAGMGTCPRRGRRTTGTTLACRAPCLRRRGPCYALDLCAASLTPRSHLAPSH